MVTGALGCRMMLNLRGSLFQPSSDDELMSIELNTIVFKTLRGNPSLMTTRDFMQDTLDQ